MPIRHIYNLPLPTRPKFAEVAMAIRSSKNGEYFTAYSNLRSVNVSVGQKVSTKQSIGVVATDQISGESSVNFVLSKGTTFVNPGIWLAPN